MPTFQITRWRVTFGFYGAAVLAPVVYYGLSDDGIIGSFSIAMLIPFVVFCVYVTGSTLCRALMPPATAIVSLSLLIFDSFHAIYRHLRSLSRR